MYVWSKNMDYIQNIEDRTLSTENYKILSRLKNEFYKVGKYVKVTQSINP